MRPFYSPETHAGADFVERPHPLRNRHDRAARGGRNKDEARRFVIRRARAFLQNGNACATCEQLFHPGKGALRTRAIMNRVGPATVRIRDIDAGKTKRRRNVRAASEALPRRRATGKTSDPPASLRPHAAWEADANMREIRRPTCTMPPLHGGKTSNERVAMSEEAESILVVDDEQSITDFVSYSLMKEGFKVDVAGNGEAGLEAAMRKHYDLFVLDIMLPGMDGYELCRRLRARTNAPVLFLSARDTELDKVVGLEIGGDDYLAKPFGVRELIARVRALLRRGSMDAANDSGALSAAGITLDEDRHIAEGENGPIDLTPREFELLAALMKDAGKVVTREDLLREAWGWEYITETKTVDTHIKRLRDKISAAGFDPGIIETVRGYGYRLRA